MTTSQNVPNAVLPLARQWQWPVALVSVQNAQNQNIMMRSRGTHRQNVLTAQSDIDHRIQHGRKPLYGVFGNIAVHALG